MFLSKTSWKHPKIFVVFRGYKVGILGSYGLIMITLIYIKEIIHLSGWDYFFARKRLILVLEQKGDLITYYRQIIWYARLPLKYTGIYLLNDKISAMNLLG